jgi:hypothetical protein
LLGAFLRRATLPLAAIVVAAAIFGLPHVRAIASNRAAAYVADPMHCELTLAPRWFGGDVESHLRESFAALSPQTLRDDAAVDAFAERIGLSSGWIKSVDRAAKRYPNRLEVEFTLRTPVALAEGAKGLVLVDADGVLVAPADEATKYLAAHSLPLVHLVRPLAAVGPGEPLRERGLRDGLAVAAEIAPYRETLRGRELDVEIIDVVAAGAARGIALSDVVLYTSRGLPIEWGRARASAPLGALEPAADAKIRGLLRVAATRPGLAGIKRIRLQFTPPSVVLEDPDGPEVSVLSRIGEEAR